MYLPQPSRSSPEVSCQLARRPTWVYRDGLPGNYSARVRAITPAGNGSWSNVLVFNIAKKMNNGEH